MNMVNVSTYLYLLQMLIMVIKLVGVGVMGSSSMSYNFMSRGLSHSCLNLILCIFFFDAIVNGIVFLVSLSDSSLLVYKNATDF